ncbi:MAG: 6-phosphofructokinase [Candidatus Aureabacteria bacterium]|nr:6-phosphofructokinase [Candidatus Auribacterota bacterium]
MSDALTGNVVVGQSGGPTCVINQSLIGVVRECSKYPQMRKVYGAIQGVKGILEENFTDLTQESIETLELVAETPSSGLKSIRMKPRKEDCVKMFEVFKAHNVRYFFYIGGNDTAETANIVNEIARRDDFELRVFHIPKTIDNDLLVTDHCPGYGSAAKFVACAVMGDNLDNRSLPGIKIDVVMGRHAGFLTAAAILARKYEDDGPHLIYVPETVFDIKKFTDDVDKVYTKYGRAVICVSEGIHDKDGNPIFTSGEKDAHGNIQLSGSGALGDYLAGEVRSKLKIKRVRADTFGYLQRCFPGVVSEVDSEEARKVGEKAVQLAASANIDGSVIIKRLAAGGSYKVEFDRTDLANVAKNTKPLDKKYINKEGNNITEEYIDYVKPLTGKLPPIGKLEMNRVPKILNK